MRKVTQSPLVDTLLCINDRLDIYITFRDKPVALRQGSEILAIHSAIGSSLVI
jgi:hypothetical protein